MSKEKNSEAVAGVGMFVAAYVDERAAEKALERMKQAKKAKDFYFDEAAVIRSDDKGKVHIKETGDMSTGKGAGIGALVGGVVGLLGGPVGLIGGAAIGALAAHGDAGFDNKSLKEIGSALVPGSSALVATTSEKFVKEIRKQAEKGDTLALARDIATDIRNHLKARQDVLYSLLLTEQGVAASKMISSPTEVAVFGIAASQEGVVAGQAVATADGVAYEIAAKTEEGAAYEAGLATEEGAAVVDAAAVNAEEEETSES